MPDINFVVKNGLTVNGSFTANSTVVNAAAIAATSLTAGANVTVNATTMFVGTATVNTTTTAGSVLLANSIANTSITPGLMVLNSGAFRANSTVVNAVAITASSLNATSVNTATANATTSLVVGGNVSVNTTAFFVSNTLGNTTATAGLISINNGAFRANSTVVNAVAITASSLNATSVNTATANATTSLVVGGNVVVNTTAFFVNNASVNTNITAGQISISGTTVNSTIYQGTANNANNLNGQSASFYANATNLTLGTLPNARLSSAIVNTSSAFTLGGTTTFAANVVISNTGELVFASNAGIYANGSLGIDRQVLTSNATTVYWSTVTTSRRVTSYGVDNTGATDATASIQAVLEQGGDWYFPAGIYNIAGAGELSDSGGVVAILTKSLYVVCHPDAIFKTIGLPLDNDMIRLRAPTGGVGLPAEKIDVSWIGGFFDQRNQCVSTSVPFNGSPGSSYPPPAGLNGLSATTDALSISLSYTIGGIDYAAARSTYVADAVFYAGTHWQVAGGDCGIIMGAGVGTSRVTNCRFFGCRDLGVYGSGIATGLQTLTVDNCHFENCFGGIHAKRNLANFLYTENTFRNCVVAMGASPVTSSSDKGVVTNNRADGCNIVFRGDRSDDNYFGADNQIYSVGAYLADNTTQVSPYGYIAIVWLQGCKRNNIAGAYCDIINPGQTSAAYGVLIEDRVLTVDGVTTTTTCTGNEIRYVRTVDFSRCAAHSGTGEGNMFFSCYNYGTAGIRDPLPLATDSVVRLNPLNAGLTFHTPIGVGNGTAALPIISRATQDNTGLFFSANKVGISAVGVERLGVTSTGVTIAGAIVGTSVNATSVNTATANATTSLVVGGNVVVNTTAFFVNNASVNTNITAGQISISGVTVNSTIYQGTSNNANNLGGLSAASYATLSGATFTGAVIGTSVNATSVNTATANATTSVVVGANVTVNTSTLFVGNASVNTSTTSGSILIANSTGNTTITPGSITTTSTVAMGSSFLRNRIINGDQQIDQRNSGATISIPSSAIRYVTDRHGVFNSGPNAITALRASIGAPDGFRNTLAITGSTGNIGASWFHRIESNNIHYLAGVTVTFSAWVWGGTRNVTPALSTPNSFENFSSQTVGPTTTWSITVFPTRFFWTFTMPANAINGAEITIGLGPLLAGQTVGITGAQLEVGSVATPFERRLFGQELLLCQRHYNRTTHYIYTPTASTPITGMIYYPPMRAAPTVSWVPSGNEYNVFSFTVDVATSTAARSIFVSGGAGAGEWNGVVVTDAEF